MPRLSDRIAIGVLTRTFPPELVDRVITQTGRGERRQRLLPARVVVYYTSRCACSPRWATKRSCGCWWRGWRGPGAGRAVGRSRTRARSPGPGHGLGRRRCGRCLWKSPGRWRPGRRRGRGIGGGGWWRRWELETALDELKTHQRGPGVVLRSTDPDGVRQEVWAHLLVHYAIRTLMHQAALDADRLSFTRSLHIARRQATSQAAFPLGGWPGRRGRRSLRRCGTCSLRAGCAVCRGWSSAR
jgi:hypothetical protein